MVNTQMIEFKANGGNAPGYLARPENATSAPGVVVIQEWWGLNNHIKSIAERFAGEGFVALAPDLYRGQVAVEPDDARKLAMELEYPQAIKDIQGAINYLRDQSDVQPKNVGVIGFCMGGRLTGLIAINGQYVGAAVPFYGIRDPLTDEDVQKITAPLLCVYGEEDAGIPLDVVNANDAKLRAAGKTVETIIYPGAPHAFFNNERPHAYRHDAAEDAWGRALAWFRQHLLN